MLVVTGEEEQTMEQQKPRGRSCPACGSTNYAFRSRKQIEADPEKGVKEAMLETKYRCKACGEEWKEKVPGVMKKVPPE
jgi:transposase-like protein